MVIDLKISEFRPEFAGKMNFYLSAVDDLLKHAEDGPSIGIVLCKMKNQVIVEYALKGINKPLGVADYQLSTALPENAQGEPAFYRRAGSGAGRRVKRFSRH